MKKLYKFPAIIIIFALVLSVATNLSKASAYSIISSNELVYNFDYAIVNRGTRNYLYANNGVSLSLSPANHSNFRIENSAGGYTIWYGNSILVSNDGNSVELVSADIHTSGYYHIQWALYKTISEYGKELIIQDGMSGKYLTVENGKLVLRESPNNLNFCWNFVLPPNTVYNIKNLNGKYLNVHYGQDANGTNVYQWTKDNSTEQKFKLVYNTNNDTYRINAMCSSNGNNRVVEPNANGSSTVANGANVRIWEPTGSTTQEWKITNTGQGIYVIKPYTNANLALTVYGSSNGTSAGTSTTSAGNVFVSTFAASGAQGWKFESINYSPYVLLKNIYNIRNVGSNKYLNVHYGIDANGTNVYQWTKDNSIEQQFKLSYNMENYSYRIHAMCSSNGTNRVLNIAGSTTNGANVNIWTPNNTVSQEWHIYSQGDLTKLSIESAANRDLSLTAYGGSNGTSAGTSANSTGNVFVSENISDYCLWQIEAVY